MWNLWKEPSFVITFYGFTLAFILFMYLTYASVIDHRESHRLDCLRSGKPSPECISVF